MKISLKIDCEVIYNIDTEDRESALRQAKHQAYKYLSDGETNFYSTVNLKASEVYK